MENFQIWIDDVIFQLKGYIGNINDTWSKTGYSPAIYSELKNSLKDSTIQHLQNILTSAEDDRSKIERQVVQLQAEIETIENELQIPHLHISSSQPLLSTLDRLNGYQSELSEKISILTAEFKKLKCCEENLCRLLHVEALDRFPLIPSCNDKLRVQHHIDELKNIKDEREKKLAAMKKRILSCIDYLKSDDHHKLPEPVQAFLTAEVESSDLSESFLHEFDRIQDQYMDLFHKFKSEEDDLFENINSLRKRLDLSPFILPREQSRCPSNRIKCGSEELVRLRELRLANLRHLMEACVLELEDIWTKCLVNTDYRQSFRNSMSLDCTEENLSRLEEEVHKWRRFNSSHQDFYESLIVWLDTLQQIKAIELKRQDPTVLKNRGGILLKLDREDRKLRTRDLPNQTSYLESIIAQECEGDDAYLFSLVCFEEQPLTGQKENSLSSIISRSLECGNATVDSAPSSKHSGTKGGFVYSANKRPAARKVSPPPSASSSSSQTNFNTKKSRMEYHSANTTRH